MDHTGFPLLQPSEADPVALTTSQMRALRLWAKAIGTHPRGSRGRIFRRLHPRSSEVLGLHSGNAVAYLLLLLFCRSSTGMSPPLGSLLPSWSHPHPPRRGQTSDSISAARHSSRCMVMVCLSVPWGQCLREKQAAPAHPVAPAPAQSRQYMVRH